MSDPDPLEPECQAVKRLAITLHFWRTTFRQSPGLIDHRQRIAENLEVGQPKRRGNFQRIKKRQPFGIHATALPGVTAIMTPAPYDHRQFHRARIGATPAIEIYLHAILDTSSAHAHKAVVMGPNADWSTHVAAVIFHAR